MPNRLWLVDSTVLGPENVAVVMREVEAGVICGVKRENVLVVVLQLVVACGAAGREVDSVHPAGGETHHSGVTVTVGQP